ncbi:MAG TPA: siderophore-interacting protein [Nocardioidaceae bacterium]|nr:siderophore-interacting protein [Nocardioidaceae bacterium]
MTVTTAHNLPMILTEAQAVGVERISPTFVRVELASPALADFGVDGKLYDQRVKLIFPNESGNLPSFDGADESWYSTWLDIPVEQRGHMRTYTARDVRGYGAETRLVVDFVLHVEDGESGPGSSWAATATSGDRLLVVGPKRGTLFGGIEFAPGTARELLLVGDETAVPAVCSILADLDADARGTALLEVPRSDDVMDVAAPEGVDVVWLPREGAGHGVRQIAAVRQHLGLAPAMESVDEPFVEPQLWETPAYSSSGEEVAGSTPTDRDMPGLYAWIAGESKVVTHLRRCLVNELGVDRSQVAFMGYWRHGVAMRS